MTTAEKYVTAAYLVVLGVVLLYVVVYSFKLQRLSRQIEELAERIASSGGRQRSKVWRIDSRTNDYRLCYCEDPFGNIIEIYTHNYETLYGGMKAGKAQDEVGGNP